MYGPVVSKSFVLMTSQCVLMLKYGIPLAVKVCNLRGPGWINHDNTFAFKQFYQGCREGL